MIDWHYGFINLLNQIPFIFAWIFLVHFQTAWGFIFLIGYLLLLVIFPSQKEDHQTTLKHFDGIFRTVLVILALLLVWLLPNISVDFVIPFLLAASNTVPSFFTRQVEEPKCGKRN